MVIYRFSELVENITQLARAVKSRFDSVENFLYNRYRMLKLLLFVEHHHASGVDR